jgi:hypothetical protein
LTHLPTLTTTVNVQWECDKRPGVERDCDVLVEFTFDGVDDFEVLGAEIVGGGEPYGISTDCFDDLVDAATIEVAAEVYGDWLSGQDGNMEAAA